MNQQTCNPAWLDAFLRNDLNESEEQMLTSHLDECSDCREELESRAAEQSAWREASSMLGGSILLSTAAISDVRSGTVRSPQIELVLKQLAPTDDPESLGRIGGYEVTGVVGAGGMGVVLKAHDRSLDRIVAVKVMSPHLASSGSARRRFAREAKAAAAVLHPNVIAIHSVASEDASPFLVMPYVRGASLQKRIDSQGPLPLKDTLRIGTQIAAGLAAAHEQGLVHRDIKPANILLEEGVERVTITDFGLARAVDDASMTCSGVIAGTPQYMSPEQTRGEPIDARSDLFSLGSVLYAMCAGRSPFRAETTYGVLHRIANDNPTPVCEVNSDVPEWLAHIIERLMAKRPEDRFESAAQVAEMLEGCLAHVQQPAAIPLPEAVAALAPKKSRRPPIGKFIAAAAGTFALFAGILIVLELGKGTLTIESELDDVPIRIMQGDELVKSLTVSKEGATTRIGAGKYIVEIGQEFDKAVIKDGSVELSRGTSAIVKVTQTNVDTAEDEKAKDEAAKAWLRRPVVGSTHDGKSFQLAGHDALMHCVMTNNSEALNRLLTVDKYDLDYCPLHGQWTLLQTALQRSCLGTTSLLLQHGANPTFASKGTPLPLELAKRSGRKELVTLVQKYLESVAHHPQTKVNDAEDERSPIQKSVDALVKVSFSGTIDGAAISASGIGWRVDDAGHILLPSHVVPTCDDEAIQLRYASGEHCSATRLKTLGHLTLLKSDQVTKGPAISLNSETSLTSGDAVSAILNGTDSVPGSIVKPRTTIALSDLEGVKISPERRFQNIITTDFVADGTMLSGAPLLTKSGDVAGMMIRLGSAQLIAIPVAEIREVLKQLTATDSAVAVPPMEFDTLEDFLKPGRELFDKEMKQIDERLAKVVEGSAEHSLLTTKKKQLQQQWDLSVAQVKGMAAAAKAGKPVQLAPIVIPNNSRPWQAPMPDPLLGHDEDIAKVLAGTWQVKRYVAGGEEAPLDGATVTFSKNMLIMHLKLGDEEGDIKQVYRIGNDKIDIWDTDSGPDIRTALPYLGSYFLENDTLRICYHGRAMELETPQSRPPVQPGKGFIFLELQRAPIAEFGSSTGCHVIRPSRSLQLIANWSTIR